MKQRIITKQISASIRIIDQKLSKRFIHLDPKGYFIIKLDQSTNEIILEHYSNDIDQYGKAINPETGKPLKCKGETERTAKKIYKGKTAKEVGIQITEGLKELPISALDHALYLGRELQRAEECLRNGENYIQD